MYPNQGFPGQYPPNNSGFQPQMPQPTPHAGFVMQQGQPGFVQQPTMPSYPSQTQPLQYPYQAQQMPYGQQPYQHQFVQPVNQLIPNALPQATPVAQQVVEKKKVKKGRPTVIPATNFDASNDAAILRKAMKGFGTDEDALINVLCRRSCDQRIEISKVFKTSYGKDLIENIRSETSGNFEKLLVALLTPKVDFYCNELFRAMDGAGTDEDALIEVMCSMSNQEIRDINAMYQIKYKRTLEKDLRGDTSGYMKRLMISLSAGGRDESMRTDVNAARQDAQALKTAGVDKFGTDESEFIRILCLRNYEQLKLICQEYQKLTGKSLEKDIKSEFSGDIEDALLAIIRYANNPVEFFASRLHKSMVGLGTNDRSLIRLCVTRCEIDMEDIKEAFQRLYGKTLKSFIKGDTSGHYKHALFTLCGESR